MLRPVGEIVPLFAGRGDADPAPCGYGLRWFDSGTTALALAIRAARTRSGRNEFRVAVPGYTCPSVVAAIIWADAIPFAIDTTADTPWLDMDSIAAQPSGFLHAVVAPHFLGIRYPLEALRDMCMSLGIDLIEDAAQMNFGGGSFHPTADLVVMSFGRGKPVPIGGGALMYRKDWSTAVDNVASRVSTSTAPAIFWKLQLAAQNLAMTRFGYTVARSLPGLGVGRTKFKPLRQPTRLADSLGRAKGNLLASWTVDAAPAQRSIAEIVDRAAQVINLPRLIGWDGRSSLLRYPILTATKDHRRQLLQSLRAAGIGASEFYDAPITEVANVPPIAQSCDLAHARQFAQRLLTLPAHSDVTAKDVAKMRRCMNASR